MFQITEDPLSDSLVQCLAKNYENVCSSVYMKALMCLHIH